MDKCVWCGDALGPDENGVIHRACMDEVDAEAGAMIKASAGAAEMEARYE